MLQEVEYATHRIEKTWSSLLSTLREAHGVTVPWALTHSVEELRELKGELYVATGLTTQPGDITHVLKPGEPANGVIAVSRTRGAVSERSGEPDLPLLRHLMKRLERFVPGLLTDEDHETGGLLALLDTLVTQLSAPPESATPVAGSSDVPDHQPPSGAPPPSGGETPGRPGFGIA